MKTLALILLFMFFVGCASKQPTDVSTRTRIYQADFKTVLKAVLAYCQEQSFAVLSVDKDLGIVNTDWKSAGGLLLHRRIKINFVLKDQESATKVVLTISEERQNNPVSGNYETYTMNDKEANKAYQDILDGIQKQI